MQWLIFLTSLLPFVELRGAIPLALLLDLGFSPLIVLVICVALNILVIPIAFFVLDFIFPIARRRVKLVDKIFQWCTERARKHRRSTLVGLATFVSIPIPGSGAYTGALITYVTGIDRKGGALAIAAGVVVAGILVWVLTIFGITWIRIL